MKKLLAIGVIFLFIGVAVAPSINSSVVKTSDDLVEVTSQACGIQGFGNNTVKLTKQQYQDLERYLVDFRARLNQTTSKEEAVPIFTDAVVELNKYGLLPKGLSVKEAQSLAIGKKSDSNDFFHSSHNKGYIINKNFLCFVAGSTTDTYFVSPAVLLGAVGFIGAAILLTYLENRFHNNTKLDHFIIGFARVLALWALAIPVAFYFAPVTLTSVLTLGESVFDSDHQEMKNYPSKGWISSVGLLGVKQWNGSFYGTLRAIEFTTPTNPFYLGILGFTGIKIIVPGKATCQFFGFAAEVGVGESPPDLKN